MRVYVYNTVSHVNIIDIRVRDGRVVFRKPRESRENDEKESSGGGNGGEKKMNWLIAVADAAAAARHKGYPGVVQRSGGFKLDKDWCESRDYILAAHGQPEMKD